MAARSKKIGLFFGSFNPVHIGHLIIANHMAHCTDLDEVWLVLSPQNPFKKKESLAKDRERLYMLNLAVEDNPALRVSDVELSLPQPSYTIDTLTHLKEKHPEHHFVLIMGGDNLPTLHKWKNFEQLIAQYAVYVYKRPGYEAEDFAHEADIRFVEAPLLDISASYIRNCIESGLSIRYMVHDAVYDYIDGSGLYKTGR